MTSDRFQARLRIAAILVGIGIAVQVFTMFWNHPLSFLAFVLVACPITAAGVLVYLITLLVREP